MDIYLFLKIKLHGNKKGMSDISYKDPITNTISVIKGVFVHRMVVFSFGDCNGRSFNADLFVVDHLDMDHKNNSVFNLEQVTDIMNKFRAYYALPYTGKCRDRFFAALHNIGSDDLYQFEIEKKQYIEMMEKDHKYFGYKETDDICLGD